MLPAEADGHESASYPRDRTGSDTRHVSGGQYAALHYRRDASSGLDARQQCHIPAKMADND